MPLRCLIIDDEPIARNGLATSIKQIEFMEVVGIAASPFHALEVMAREKPDLLFLDIEMPRLNGLEFVKTLKEPPMVIITTAFSKYAVEGFELDVIDYLVKPIGFSRLLKACKKAHQFHQIKNETPEKSSDNSGFFFTKVNGKHEKIYFNDIFFIEAANNYIILHTTSKKIMIHESLKNILEILPSDNFLKVQKSFIIAIDKVTGIKGNSITINDSLIPMSRNLRDTITKRILSQQHRDLASAQQNRI